eukprot:763507-Hanusia_phi.AAC.2
MWAFPPSAYHYPGGYPPQQPGMPQAYPPPAVSAGCYAWECTDEDYRCILLKVRCSPMEHGLPDTQGCRQPTPLLWESSARCQRSVPRAGGGGKRLDVLFVNVRTNDVLEQQVLQGGPKKPATSFVLFSNTVREEVKAANPGLSFLELGKKLGEMWREMDPAVRKEYEDRATAAKDRYLEEKKIWLAQRAAGMTQD